MLRYCNKTTKLFVSRLNKLSSFNKSIYKIPLLPSSLRVAHFSYGADSANKQPSSIPSKIQEVNETKYDYLFRHVGPQPEEQHQILKAIGVETHEELMSKTVPSNIRLKKRLNLPEPLSEQDALKEFKQTMSKNKLFKTYIGMGYYNTITPTVILRNIIENPSWYTPYTPYQAEIAQGRLQMLLNFQTMVSNLVGKELCNASLLDEATSCAEAMTMALNLSKHQKRNVFLVSENLHVQNISVMQTRAAPLGINIKIVPDEDLIKSIDDNVFGVIVQYPNTNGKIVDFRSLVEKAKSNETDVIAATDLLACSKITPPGEWGANIVVGTSQRFGVPLGYGGPHAGFLATDETRMRKMPGRIIGVTKDSRGKLALRMALQTREQHIRREKATSNICTAQALLANVSAAYAIYHGPKGILNIADRVHNYISILALGLENIGFKILNKNAFFDTIHVQSKKPSKFYLEKCWENKINIRPINNETFSISFDETTQLSDIDTLLQILSSVDGKEIKQNVKELEKKLNSQNIPSNLQRKSPILTHENFNLYHSETALMRYLYSLERKDLGLNTAMIPLGSCTMKLNSATVMTPVTWPEINSIHPFVPTWQSEGYKEMINNIEKWLAEITGFDAVSLQPNSGAQGEYAGLMCIRAYHLSRNEKHRNICLIPTSAHGTNPASAALVGWKVVPVACTDEGDVDLNDLKRLAEKHKDKLACVMVTYPSTYGIFEKGIRDVCKIIHDNGGLVYMDGANLQAQVGYCSPGDIGADVCHLNLHKTFCIPHGGGGPGLGPIGVAKHLTKFLPSHPVINDCAKDINNAIGPVTGAPWSSASILPIPFMYIRMMGTRGLEMATSQSIANANYMAKKLKNHYDILFINKKGYCAHEFIIDLSEFKKSCGITAEDVAKRLMDYGFHAPTMSWPVTDTLMVEPTESEPLSELNRLCEAFISIREEIKQVETGKISAQDSVLRGAPHTIDVITADNWNRKYTRQQAAAPLPYLKYKSYWPTVGRVDNVYGDKNPVCSCPPMSEFTDE